MRAPDFLIVGAARSGTTALCRLLEQHPQLFLPAIKEPCFYVFATRKPDFRNGKFAFAITSEDKYKKLFSMAPLTSQVGEASTPYLYLYDTAIANIRKYHPSPNTVKIVILLRHPVDRAYSNYKWRVRDGREPLSFEAALEAEQERRKAGYSFDYFYTDRSRYFEAVKAYTAAFPKVHVILYDDFIGATEKTLEHLCEFLEVDSAFKFELVHDVNSSYTSRWPWLSRLLTTESKLKFQLLYLLPSALRDRLRHRIMRWTQSEHKADVISPETRTRLLRYFQTDVEKLSELLQRDLSIWMR